MDVLELAIRLAAKELETEHEFFFEETGEDDLVQVMLKHVAPLVNVEHYKSMRITALKNEIAALKSSKKPNRPNK